MPTLETDVGRAVGRGWCSQMEKECGKGKNLRPGPQVSHHFLRHTYDGEKTGRGEEHRLGSSLERILAPLTPHCAAGSNPHLQRATKSLGGLRGAAGGGWKGALPSHSSAK